MELILLTNFGSVPDLTVNFIKILILYVFQRINDVSVKQSSFGIYYWFYQQRCPSSKQLSYNYHKTKNNNLQTEARNYRIL